MKIKIFLLISFFLFTNFLIFSQEIFEVKNLMVTNNLEGVLTIEIYSDKEIYKNDKCSYPENSNEQKFCNFFNLNTKEKLTTFFSPYNIPSAYAKEDYLDKMKIYNKKNNFYELDSKYTLDYGISKDVFIKYINHNEVFPKPVYSSIYIQDFNNKVLIKEMGENFDLGLFLISSNTKKIINYLSKSGNKEFDISSLCSRFLDNIKSNSNKNDLYSLIDKKYSPFFSDKSDEEVSLKENFSQNIFTYKYTKTFHDIVSGIVLKKRIMSKKEVSEKYNIPFESIAKDSLSVKEIININTLNNDFTIIKFYDYKPIIQTKFEVINNNLINKNSNMLTILSKLNLEVFVDLYVNEKSKKFPEINQFQLLIKNANGIDVNKLAEILEKNKATLSKYLDE